MDFYDTFKSCCAAIDRLLDGVEADTTDEMSEEQLAYQYVYAARRDHPFTDDFWMRYRCPEGENTSGATTEYLDGPKPDYRIGTGTDYSYRIGEKDNGKTRGKKGSKAKSNPAQTQE